MATIHQLFKGSVHANALQAKDSFICGVEHEVENFKGNFIGFPEGTFSTTDDGSLQHGIEIITTPMNVEKQCAFFKALHSTQWGERFSKYAYSDRTSTHVHVNAAQLEYEELRSMVMLYSLAEPYFFAYVGEEREHNIHCVPLWATTLTKHLYKDAGLGILEQRWHKYTALNLKPLKTIKTVEFRHLFGTEDFNSFKTWLLILESLYNWTKQNKGKFATQEIKPLLISGYAAVQNYLFKETGDFGQYMESLIPYVNKERAYDVYLTAVLDTFEGVKNLTNFSK